MESKKVYLDYSATTPLRPEILEEMIGTAPSFGNPSSVHQIGQKSNHLLNQCRDNISHLLGCQSSLFLLGEQQKAIILFYKE